MNAELRQRLREEIDSRIRSTVVASRDGCAGCGCHLDTYVVACRACTQRKLKRERVAQRKQASRRKRKAAAA